MSDVVIRTFEGRDVEKIVALWNQVLKCDPISQSRLVQWVLADPDYWPGEDSGFFVAVIRDEPVGFLRAIIRRVPNERLGLEPEVGWIPLVAVETGHQRKGIGMALMDTAIAYFRRHQRKRIWVCGGSGSAPAYIFPGVDNDAYPGGLALFAKAGFKVDRGSVGMSREIVSFDLDEYHRQAWLQGKDVQVMVLTPELVQDFFIFMAETFPGDWISAARVKIQAGALHEVLVAIVEGRIVGYCQWVGEHFGPFGVQSEYRRHKIGSKLFVEAVRRIRQADGRTVWFNWAEDDAARFYSRFGMKATRRYTIFEKVF